MACFFPYNSRNLDTSFFIFRPTIVIVDDLVEALKHFSYSTESLGCVHSAIFRSIHGNMVCVQFLNFYLFLFYTKKGKFSYFVGFRSFVISVDMIILLSIELHLSNSLYSNCFSIFLEATLNS